METMTRDFYLEAREAIAQACYEKYEEIVEADTVNLFYSSEVMNLHVFLGRIQGGADRIYYVTIDEYAEAPAVKVYVPEE